MAQISPELAALMARSSRGPIGVGSSQPQRPLPFRERMVQERDRAQAALNKANFAIEQYDSSEDIINFINKIESE